MQHNLDPVLAVDPAMLGEVDEDEYEYEYEYNDTETEVRLANPFVACAWMGF